VTLFLSSDAAIRAVDGRGSTAAILEKITVLRRDRGALGLSPEEKAFIQDVKELWKDEILPGIFNTVKEARSEMETLMQAVLDCEVHKQQNDDTLVDIAKAISHYHFDLDECIHREDNLLTSMKEKCAAVKDMKITIVSGSKTPAPATWASHDDKVEYLKDMNTFFCGTNEEFRDKMHDCGNATQSFMDQSKDCTDIQNHLESLFCQWRQLTAGMCRYYEECMLESLGRFNAAKENITVRQEQVQKEYEAAVRIECLWDAWDLAETPCLVDDEKVDECYELPIDFDNVTVTIPLVPDSHECKMSTEDLELSHGPDDHPCTEEYVSQHYVPFDISDATLQKMRDVCIECPEIPEPSTTTTTTFEDAPILISRDRKCPLDHGDRIYRERGMTLESCYQLCVKTPGCQYLSFAETGRYAGVCMGCVEGLWEPHDGFNAYDLPHPLAAANRLYEHTEDDKRCSDPLFEVGDTTTSACYEKCLETPGCRSFSYKVHHECRGCANADYEQADRYYVYALVNTSSTS